MLVSSDADYRIPDVYFPHVGQENHVGRHACRFGFFADGVFSWVGPEWRAATRHDFEAAVAMEELDTARAVLDWVAAQAAVSGVLPEQVDPLDGRARSVSPLTCSHAEFIPAARCLGERRAEVATLTGDRSTEESKS